MLQVHASSMKRKEGRGGEAAKDLGGQMNPNWDNIASAASISLWHFKGSCSPQ